MRIRKRLQSHLPPPDSSFLPSPHLAGASATGVSSLPDRGARASAQESVAAEADVLERETGSRRTGLLRFSGEGIILSPPGNECISGEFSVLSSHRPPPKSEIEGRDLSPYSLFPYLIEAVKREANEDAPSNRFGAEGSSQSKTKRGGCRHLRRSTTVKAEERENFKDDEEGEENRENGKKAAAVKKRRRPAVLMEGSRCSRVNGRGWRCSQQTLVGYSLCEHHLGKSRLRSVNNDKCNDRMKKKELLTSEEDSEAEERMSKKMKRKIGKVKARSLSSLLNQTQVSIGAQPPLSSPVGFCT